VSLLRGKKLVHVFTVPDSLIFAWEQIRHSRALGMEVTVITSEGPLLREAQRSLDIKVKAVEMPRRISLRDDLRAIAQIHTVLERIQPHIVHSHTPKGGLLGTLAAHAAKTPVRIYQMRGLPHVTRRGAERALLMMTERVTCQAATHVICEGPSLRRAAIADALVTNEKAQVLHNGSNGVDVRGRFRLPNDSSRVAAREALGVDDATVLFLFVGRLVRDKGVPELLRAFQHVQRDCTARLVVVGPREARDALSPEDTRLLETSLVSYVGYQRDVRPFYAASDVLVLPSYREGFPNVPLEAAAMGLPVITTDAIGCIDSIEPNKTGLMVPVGDQHALEDAMRTYALDEGLRRRHGAQGRIRAESMFDMQQVIHEMHTYYEHRLGALGGE
jgi:glycosyltransferase involved in cell wall biosynthesis